MTSLGNVLDLLADIWVVDVRANTANVPDLLVQGNPQLCFNMEPLWVADMDSYLEFSKAQVTWGCLVWAAQAE